MHTCMQTIWQRELLMQKYEGRRHVQHAAGWFSCYRLLDLVTCPCKSQQFQHPLPSSHPRTHLLHLPTLYLAHSC